MAVHFSIPKCFCSSLAFLSQTTSVNAFIIMASTSYGPRGRLVFDGDDEKYELWEVKFTSYLRLQKLHLALADDYDGDDSDELNARIFAELVQLLDDKSLSLIMRDAM